MFEKILEAEPDDAVRLHLESNTNHHHPLSAGWPRAATLSVVSAISTPVQAAAQNRDFIMIELKVKEFQRAQDLQKEGRLQQAADVYCEIDLDDPITNEIRFFIANNYGNCLVQLGKNYEALQVRPP